MGPGRKPDVKSVANGALENFNLLLSLQDAAKNTYPNSARFAPRLDDGDPRLQGIQQGADKFKRILKESYREKGPAEDKAEEEKISRSLLKHRENEINTVMDNVSRHTGEQFYTWTKTCVFNESQWQKPFKDAKDEIQRIYNEAAAELKEPAPAKGAADAKRFADETKVYEEQKAYITAEQAKANAVLNEIQKDAVEQFWTATKEILQKQKTNADSEWKRNMIIAEMQVPIIWRKSDEEIRKATPGYGCVTYDTPPPDGVYYQEDEKHELKTEAVALLVSGGKVSILGKGDKYEPTYQDYDKMFNFVRHRCSTDNVVLGLNNADSSSDYSFGKGVKHLEMMLKLAALKNMKVSLDEATQAFLNARPKEKAKIDLRIAEINDAYDARYPKTNVAAKYYDDLTKNRLDGQIKTLNDNAVDIGLHVNPNAVAREIAFLGYDPGRAAAPTPQEEKKAEASIKRLKERVENLEKTRNTLEGELHDLKQEIKKALADQASTEAKVQAAGNARMITLEQRFDSLIQMRGLYKTERDDLVSRLSVFSPPPNDVAPAILKVAPEFAGFPEKVAIALSASVENMRSPVVGAGVAAALGTFEHLKQTMEVDRKNELKEAEEAKLGPRRR